MQLKFDIILENINTILFLLILLLIIKTVIIFSIIKISNNKRLSLMTAFSLFQF